MKDLILKANFIKYFLFFVILSSCTTDKQELDGHLIQVRGKYYKMENRIGNSYVLDPVKIDRLFLF